MQTEGGEDDQPEGRDPTGNNDMDEDTYSIDPAPSVEENSVVVILIRSQGGRE